jgi:transcriptional regulator with XRE-family HTH domain
MAVLLPAPLRNIGIAMAPGPHHFDRHVGEQIRRLRVLAGKSQAELGTVLGLTFQQVQKYERGANRISAEKLLALSQYFNVEITYFFDGAGPAAPPPETGRKRDNARLRLEIARALQTIDSTTLLRGLLGLIRSFGVPDE